ncbi:MAG: hypothetical protein O9346_07525 [Leptospiraceae bacterium]|nr:hypothetical protein [Leptospiraceae bacterium]MCZ8346248.1 hypothetical protein [Leptospiraceae bacterium]
MKIFKLNINLARFFQIESVIKTISKLSQNHKYSSNFQITFYALILFLLSSQISFLEAHEWKLLHESEVERVFEMDQDLTSAKISQADWESTKDATSNANSELADYSNPSEESRAVLFQDSYLPIEVGPLNAFEAYGFANIETYGKAWSLESFLKNSCLEVQIPHYKFTSHRSRLHFMAFLDVLPGINKDSSNHKMSFPVARNPRDFIGEIDTAVNTYILGISDSFVLWARTSIFKFKNLDLDQFDHWITREFQERGNVLAKVNIPKNLFANVSHAWEFLSQSQNQSLMFSEEASLGKEKRIVRNQNWKILSLWHPNLNELHLVNCSMQCEDFLLKLMTMKFVRDLKFFC